MTLRSLFFRLLKEDMKRRIWTLALVTLAFVFILPIRVALQLEQFISDDKWTLEHLIELMGPTFPLLIAITIISAFISGLSGFFYLQSRKKVDLYHSIPVRRETMFSVSYINGLFIFIVPYIANLLLCFLILGVNSHMHIEVFTAALSAFAINLLYYCLIYTVTIIAVMMTGSIVVSTLGTLVFLLYGPIILGIKDLFCSTFFQTYYHMNYYGENYYFSSPLFSYYEVLDKYVLKEKYQYLIITSIITLVILIALAVLLYKKRPSEAAGNAMAFGVTKPVIKFLLVIPTTLAGGIILRNVVTNNSDVWFVFGLLFTLVIVYAIIQVIYNFDIRSALKQKKQLLACLFVAGLISCVFRFDLLHVDSYIPKENEIEYMSVYISGIDEQLEYFAPDDYNSYSSNNMIYHLQNMKMNDFAAAYELAQVGIESLENTRKLGYVVDNFGYSINYYTYIVKYTLNSGKQVYRKYCIEDGMGQDLIKKIYENKEYKEVHYPISKIKISEIDNVQIDYASEILNYTVSDSNGNGNIYLNNMTDSKDIRQLVETYKEELNNLSIKEISGSNPVATMSITANKNQYNRYYIFPSFTRTLSILEARGFDITKTIDIKMVQEINVCKPVIQDGMFKDTKSKTYTDETNISKIFPLLVDQEFSIMNRTLSKNDNVITVTVNYITSDNQVQCLYFNFREGQIPDIVKKDLDLDE